MVQIDHLVETAAEEIDRIAHLKEVRIFLGDYLIPTIESAFMRVVFACVKLSNCPCMP